MHFVTLTAACRAMPRREWTLSGASLCPLAGPSFWQMLPLAGFAKGRRRCSRRDAFGIGAIHAHCRRFLGTYVGPVVRIIFQSDAAFGHRSTRLDGLFCPKFASCRRFRPAATNG
jgi:hypothetical protein